MSIPNRISKRISADGSAVLLAMEMLRPGKGERHGVIGLVTTRKDRLSMALLGSAHIFFAWLGLWVLLVIADGMQICEQASNDSHGLSNHLSLTVIQNCFHKSLNVKDLFLLTPRTRTVSLSSTAAALAFGT